MKTPLRSSSSPTTNTSHHAHQIMSFSAPSVILFNTSRDSVSTTPLNRLFQYITAHSEKKVFLLSSLNLHWCNLKSLSLIPGHNCICTLSTFGFMGGDSKHFNIGHVKAGLINLLFFTEKPGYMPQMQNKQTSEESQSLLKGRQRPGTYDMNAALKKLFLTQEQLTEIISIAQHEFIQPFSNSIRQVW